MARINGPLRVLALVVLCSQVMAGPAVADTPTPRPTPSPPPGAPGSPAPAPLPSPTGTLPLSPDEVAQALAVIQATSLLTRLDAEQQLALAQRAFIGRRMAQLRPEREALTERVAALRDQAADRQRKLDRILREEYRSSKRTPLEVLLTTGSILSALSATNALGSLADAEHVVLRELQQTQAEQEARRVELAAHETELASLTEALDAKDRALATLRSQAQRLAAGGPAEIAILKELVDQQLEASVTIDQLIAQATAATGAPPPPSVGWVWPARGAVTQEFGPTSLGLEPPLAFHGITYPHFHAAIDIAAPLGSPVVAAQAGRVAFVGHLPDGAEVVLLAHDGGLFTLYAHLDDSHVPPPVRAGDLVKAGALLGVVGLTGILTGAHLHFVVRRGDEPVDPRSLLAAPPAP